MKRLFRSWPPNAVLRMFSSIEPSSTCLPLSGPGIKQTPPVYRHLLLVVRKHQVVIAAWCNTPCDLLADVLSDEFPVLGINPDELESHAWLLEQALAVAVGVKDHSIDGNEPVLDENRY